MQEAKPDVPTGFQESAHAAATFSCLCTLRHIRPSIALSQQGLPSVYLNCKQAWFQESLLLL